MEVLNDKGQNKIITIPPVFADKEASSFQHFHRKTLVDIDKENDLKDLRILHNDIVKYLVIEYNEPLRPNVLIKFSRPLTERIEVEEPEYLLRCQFFWWEDVDGIPHIRLARPYIDFDEEISLLELQ